jgi:hypothetical protein
MIMAFGLLAIAPLNSWAGEIDVLLQKLVDKGILSSTEASDIKKETQTQVKKELESAQSYAVPKWVQSIKVKGDVRTRYQYEKKEMSSSPRHRGRVRARLAATANIADDIEAGIGLASGGADPRSTNQSFQDTFQTPDIRLDYAYGQWKTPVKGLKVIAGKFGFKDYLWVPTDLLWDGDINPEGGSFNYKTALLDNVDLWINGGVWVMDELSGARDPFMKYIQSGLGFKEGGLDSKFAVTFYEPRNVRFGTLDNSASSNTMVGGKLQSSYRSVAFGSEVGYKELFGGLPFKLDERIAIFGEYVMNLDDEIIKDNLSGHAFGFRFGHGKVDKPGSWQFRYIKAKLGKDAFLDTFPDSDRFGGETGIESHEGIFEYALKKNVTLGLDFYKSWRIGSPDNKDRLVQADVTFKF